MKHIIFLLCFAFIVVNAIAESPPGFSELQKIEMNSHAYPDLIAPTVEAVQEDGNLFSLECRAFELPQNIPTIGRTSCPPAEWHGNTLRSCYQNSDEINSTYQSNEPNTAPKATNESNADFKVGWQVAAK